MPKDWAIGCSDSGWMTAETFFEYVTNVFHPWLVTNNIKFPVILYLDGHASHLSYPLTKFCRENKIELIALYPNATHILQPMDVAMFRPLKAAWSHEVRDWRMEHNGESLKRENFAPLLDKSLNTLNTSEILKNGFKSTGLQPFCPDAINYKKYFESSEIDKTAETVSSIDSSKIIDNLTFIENNIDDNLLEEFRSQEKFAYWKGNQEHASLFLFWQKIKKLSSSHLPTTISSVQLSDNEEHQDNIQMEEKELEGEETEENNHKFILDAQPSKEVIIFAVDDDGNLVSVDDNRMDTDYNSQDEEQASSQVQILSENELEKQEF
ncbi:uncharacterized protein LOC113389098 [Ctenocephalides felis]|uniref:uncharacterized protein LOC113389098 n=1 Tax=Ctenocephalides felis TaxID=7515 RepID=UPI000E6E4E28|nr:uncharacterized protein LOC113389098 [Ctenocephalides felis]